MSSMISCVGWIRRGVAQSVPDKVELDGEELKALIEQAEGELSESKAEKRKQKALDAAKDVLVGSKSSKKSSSTTGIEDELAEFNLDTYDDDDNGDGQGVSMDGVAGFKGLSYYTSNSEDPYITLKNTNDDEEIEDFTIKPTDNLIVVGQTEDDFSRLEVYVYEENEDNLYIHHDLIMTAFPLCTEWLDFDPETEEAGNLLAIGNMTPDIEIWDLDIVDALQPICTLAGAKKKSSGKKKKDSDSNTDGHTDAVLGLSWNQPNRNLFASASADQTVKLWDLKQLRCLRTFTHHTNKVQVVEWNHQNVTYLLTGSFDKTAAVFDTRTPNDVARWALPADVESGLWNPLVPEVFVMSCEDGNVIVGDVRSPGTPLYTINAHDKAVTSVAMSAVVPGLLITASPDKKVKVWDIAGAQPEFVFSKEFKAGPIYAAGFCPDSPFTVAFGGGKGVLKVWDLLESSAVRRRFEARCNFKLRSSKAGNEPKEEVEEGAEPEELEAMERDMDSDSEEEALTEQAFSVSSKASKPAAGKKKGAGRVGKGAAAAAAVRAEIASKSWTVSSAADVAAILNDPTPSPAASAGAGASSTAAAAKKKKKPKKK